MRSIAHWACVLLLHAQLGAQYWAPAELPIEVDTQLRQFHWEDQSNTFYVVGRTRVPEGSLEIHRVGILQHRAGMWDTLGLFSSDVYSVAEWGDTLFVNGPNSVNGMPIPGSMALRYDDEWHADPQFTHWSHGGWLRKVNGSLYVLGNFLDTLGQFVHGVGKRQGGHWVQVGNMPPSLTGNGIAHQFFDIIEYNGQLVVTGNINTAIGDDVFVLQGNDWLPLGGGLQGWWSFGKRLAVYQGDLYLAGAFAMNAGDVGQNIMRWDGQQWHPLGTGLQVHLGNFNHVGSVQDMLVHDDELWIAGGFRYAGGVPAQMIVRWNGSEFCSVGGGPSDVIFCMGFFQDTLYINFLGHVDGEVMNHTAKFIAPAYEDNCGLWASVEEQEVQPNLLRAWQQGETIAVAGLPAGTHRVLVTDAAGRVVGSLRATSDGQLGTLRFLPWAEGTYILVFPDLGKQSRLFITKW